MVAKGHWLKCKVTKSSVEGAFFPKQQISYLGKVTDGFPVFPYGMHANLPQNNLGFIVDEGGRLFMGTSAVGRLKPMAQNEVIFFHEKSGAFIHFRNSGDIDIDTTQSSGNVNITANGVIVDAPLATFTGNVQIDGDLTVDGSTILSSTVTSNGKDISDTHEHEGSPTAPTGGVSNTGTPV